MAPRRGSGRPASNRRRGAAGPGDRYGLHEHPYTKLLVCAEGSITFLVGPDEQPVELSAGEGFELPPGTPHAAVVGPAGCTCVEGHRR